MQYPKPVTYRSLDYLAWIRTKPCYRCGKTPVEAHHESLGRKGWGMKPPDSHCIPLCFDCHRGRHQFGVDTWWAPYYDPKMIIIELLTEYLSEHSK